MKALLRCVGERAPRFARRQTSCGMELFESRADASDQTNMSRASIASSYARITRSSSPSAGRHWVRHKTPHCVTELPTPTTNRSFRALCRCASQRQAPRRCQQRDSLSASAWWDIAWPYGAPYSRSLQRAILAFTPLPWAGMCYDEGMSRALKSERITHTLPLSRNESVAGLRAECPAQACTDAYKHVCER